MFSVVTKALVEYLVVADASVYQSHSTYLQSTDSDYIMQHMKIYFSHIVNGVNINNALFFLFRFFYKLMDIF